MKLCMPPRFLSLSLSLLALPVLLSAAPLSAFSQPDPADHAETAGESGSERIAYRRLTWADFRVDDKAPGKAAQTQTFLSYQYTARAEGVPGTFRAVVAKITFIGGFDRGKSWRRSIVQPDNTLLLNHEQGHLDINELKLRQLCALKPEEMPEGYGADARTALDDLDLKMRDFYKWHVEDMEQIQRRYDSETQHGILRDIQDTWNSRVRQALKLATSLKREATATDLGGKAPLPPRTR